MSTQAIQAGEAFIQLNIKSDEFQKTIVEMKPPPPPLFTIGPGGSRRPRFSRKANVKTLFFRFVLDFHKFDWFPIDKFGCFGKIEDNKNEERGNKKRPTNNHPGPIVKTFRRRSKEPPNTRPRGHHFTIGRPSQRGHGGQPDRHSDHFTRSKPAKYLKSITKLLK